MTKNAERVLACIHSLVACHEHPTAEDVYRHLHESGVCISLATVYNSLNTLTSDQKIRRIPIEDGPDRYDRMIRHDHLICRRCKKPFDVFLPDITETIEKQLGFPIERYELQCLILCEECKKQEKT